MASLEERLAQQEGLRASQDRDLSDLAATLRAQHHTLQALALTSSEHNFMLTDLRRQVERLAADTASGLQRITDTLALLIERGNE